MATITLNGITGNSPYNITVCDGFGNNCVNFPSVPGILPITLTLPALYDSAPITMVTISDSFKCTKMELFYCDDTYPEYICFNIEYNDGLGSIDYPISLKIDENINNVPSYVGNFFGSSVLMFWSGFEWVITPFGYGYTSIGPDLFYGIWGTIGLNIGSLSDDYCPSICVFTDDGINQFTQPLQYIIYDYPFGNQLTTYQDGLVNYSVEWNSGTTQWEYYESSVLIATLSGTENVTPIGNWVLEPGSSYTNIVTSLVCPSISSAAKQFQDDNYFFFMDAELYDFQN